jgi:hypothetical protein
MVFLFIRKDAVASSPRLSFKCNQTNPVLLQVKTKSILKRLAEKLLWPFSVLE